jgi:sugar lactone lactonase YvrE
MATSGRVDRPRTGRRSIEGDKSTNQAPGRAPLAARAAEAAAPTIRHAALLLTALLVLAVVFTSRADAYVYWADAFHGSIWRANLDGTGVEETFITGAQAPQGVAVDDEHIYWPNRESIGRANLDGTGVDQSFISGVEFASGGRGDTAVAVDEEHIYWPSKFADTCCPGDPATGAIARANLDGTGVEESYITGVDFPAGELAVDGSHLYWNNYSSAFQVTYLYGGPDRIGRANLDGTGVEEDFIAHSQLIYGMAVDDTHLWWANYGREYGAITRANLDGTGVEEVISDEDEGPYYPDTVAVDETHVYWDEGGSIGRAKLDGTGLDHEFIADVADVTGLAVDGLPFTFGELKRNRNRGTAKLGVNLPRSGDLELAKTGKVRPAEKRAAEEGSVTLPVKPKRKAKRKLGIKGKARVNAKVTFTPDGGEPNTLNESIKLIKRR